MVHRIDGTSQAAALPAAGAVVGTPGYFTEGNPGTGTPATIVSQAWANMVQEELANLVLGAGLALTKGSNNQVESALKTLFPGMYAAGRVLANPGYMRLPGGLILQWMRNRSNTTNGSGDATIIWTYPVAFTTAVLGYSVVADDESTIRSQVTANVGSASTTTITTYVNVPGATAGTLAAVSGFVIGV